ncbi:restriction endonuclease subunit S [Mogibacterium diversum]|uniref:restriction endonuclease subunit S n=1 Tax=Mogibacterium diversum TaxID=114527 RepID=UPI001CAEC123|nr:restriction endonuclease subunit S [Mogibacterium diversum]MBF1319352.1 restriction endonuclease subunit S [Mogibacterium diversum]
MKYVKLGNIAKFRYGKMPDKDKFLDDGYPVFSGYRITGYYSEYMVENPTLIVVARGVGGTGDVKISPPKSYITNLSIIVDLDESVADMRYLYYQFVCNNLRYLDTGAAQSQITINNLSKHKALLPRLVIQKKTSSILTTYDNLIENNNKRICILEQMAENLYKEWFVRFRFPGYENTKFTDGIPSDWQILRLSDFCYVTDGTHDTPKPINDGGVPLVTGKCIKNGFIDFNEPYNISYQDHESISKRSGLQTGDILFSNIGTVGTTCFVNYDREFSVKNVIILKPGNIKVSNYLYSWLNSDSIQAIFATQTNGASQQFVGLNFMRRFKILVPNENVLDLYSDRIKSIRTEIVKLHDINENLTKQRDMLLPRLMRGKLEV